MKLDDVIKSCFAAAQGEKIGPRYAAFVFEPGFLIEVVKLLFELKGRRDADTLFLSSKDIRPPAVNWIRPLELAKAIFNHNEWFAKQVEDFHFQAPEIRVERIMMIVRQLMEMREEDKDCFACRTPMFEAGEKALPVLDGRAKEGDLCCPACGHIERKAEVGDGEQQPDGTRTQSARNGKVSP